MTVLVYKHLSLKYFVQALLVNKTKVRNNGVMIYKTIKKHNQKRIYNKKGTAQIKRNFKYRHKKKKIGTECVKVKKG